MLHENAVLIRDERREYPQHENDLHTTLTDGGDALAHQRQGHIDDRQHIDIPQQSLNGMEQDRREQARREIVQQIGMLEQIDDSPDEQRRQNHPQTALDKAAARHRHGQQQGARNHEEQVAIYRHQHGIDRTSNRRCVVIGVVLTYRGVNEDDQQASDDTQDVKVRDAPLQSGLAQHRFSYKLGVNHSISNI